MGQNQSSGRMLAGGGGAFCRRLLAAFSCASRISSAEASLESAAPLGIALGVSAFTTDSPSPDVKTLGFAGTGERRARPAGGLPLDEELSRRRFVLRERERLEGGLLRPRLGLRSRRLLCGERERTGRRRRSGLEPRAWLLLRSLEARLGGGPCLTGEGLLRILNCLGRLRSLGGGAAGRLLRAGPVPALAGGAAAAEPRSDLGAPAAATAEAELAVATEAALATAAAAASATEGCAPGSEAAGAGAGCEAASAGGIVVVTEATNLANSARMASRGVAPPVLGCELFMNSVASAII